jgi:hypothetical protein
MQIDFRLALVGLGLLASLAGCSSGDRTPGAASTTAPSTSQAPGAPTAPPSSSSASAPPATTSPAPGPGAPAPPAVVGDTYHVDPVAGSAQGDGSSADPWKTLEEVASGGQISQVQPTDLILLYTGNHGDVSLSGDNSDFITIAAAQGHTPHLERLQIRQGSRWWIKGLTVSPAFAATSYSGSIVSIGEGGVSSELVVEDCFVYTALDSSQWSVNDWLSANNGINAGRNGTNLVLRNNHVLNTRFAIGLTSSDTLCEGNIVSEFSGDGIRVTRDDQTVQHNVIKNAYVSDADGDSNHDDAIQCFLFNVGTGTVRRAIIRENIIINREDDQQPYATTCQAIGFFDGPLVDFVVEGNVILTDHWHGVSLYDAQGCKVLDNVAHTRWNTNRKPWVMLGEKKNLANGNTVQGNYAHSFNFTADPSVSATNNQSVTQQIYDTRLAALHSQISVAFGQFHPISRYARLGNTRSP